MKFFKGSFVLIVLMVITMFFLTAARPFQDTGPTPVDGPAPLTVPVAVGLFLTAGIGFLLTNGLKSLSLAFQKRWAWFPDLSGLGSVATTAIVTTVILFANTILAAVPASTVPIITGVAMAVGAILGAYGIHFTVKGLAPKP